MSRETPLDVASELESLLHNEGLEDSRAASILADLQSALRSRSADEEENSDYTKSRAQALRSLALKMKALIATSRRNDMTYADRAKALAVVSDSYLKLAHAFKTDPKMWTLAQSELVPMLTQVSDEESIDEALIMVGSHLDTYLLSLDFWLGK
jgi:hypothetical protein